MGPSWRSPIGRPTPDFSSWVLSSNNSMSQLHKNYLSFHENSSSHAYVEPMTHSSELHHIDFLHSDHLL